MGKFKKGLFFGSLMGAGMMWLNATPKGKEMRSKLLEHSKPLYDELRDSLKQLEGPTKEMYEALVERAVAEYGDRKDMADEMKMMLIRDLKKKWKKLEKEIKK